jgi:type I restriction enzyme R subunit
MSQLHHECELERHIVEQLTASWLVGGDPAAYDKALA